MLHETSIYKDPMSKKKRLFYIKEIGRSINYIETIDENFKITTTDDPDRALKVTFKSLLPSITKIESTNRCRINVRSMEDAKKIWKNNHKESNSRDKKL